MSFVVETGRIEIANPVGLPVFSTDDGLFHTISVVTATVNVPNLSFPDGSSGGPIVDLSLIHI